MLAVPYRSSIWRTTSAASADRPAACRAIARAFKPLADPESAAACAKGNAA